MFCSDLCLCFLVPLLTLSVFTRRVFSSVIRSSTPFVLSLLSSSFLQARWAIQAALVRAELSRFTFVERTEQDYLQSLSSSTDRRIRKGRLSFSSFEASSTRGDILSMQPRRHEEKKIVCGGEQGTRRRRREQARDTEERALVQLTMRSRPLRGLNTGMEAGDPHGKAERSLTGSHFMLVLFLLFISLC